MHQTLTDRQLLEDLQARGLERAPEFSWQRAAESTQKLYRQVATGEQSVGSKAKAEINAYHRQPESRQSL